MKAERAGVKFSKVLINNAAAVAGHLKITPDNLEVEIATDHFGPFLFTKLLAPKLLASTAPGCTPRVVFVSSRAHGRGTGIDFDTFPTPAADASKWNSFAAYTAAKSANILTALELSKRAKGRLNAYSLHPGGARSVLLYIL